MLASVTFALQMDLLKTAINEKEEEITLTKLLSLSTHIYTHTRQKYFCIQYSNHQYLATQENLCRMFHVPYVMHRNIDFSYSKINPHIQVSLSAQSDCWINGLDITDKTLFALLYQNLIHFFYVENLSYYHKTIVNTHDFFH